MEKLSNTTITFNYSNYNIKQFVNILCVYVWERKREIVGQFNLAKIYITSTIFPYLFPVFVFVCKTLWSHLVRMRTAFFVFLPLRPPWSRAGWMKQLHEALHVRELVWTIPPGPQKHQHATEPLISLPPLSRFPVWSDTSAETVSINVHALNMARIFVYALNMFLLFDLVEVKHTDSFKRDVDAPKDMLAVHMFKLYEKFNKERKSHRDENTVRSFQALSGKTVYICLYVFMYTFSHMFFVTFF